MSNDELDRYMFTIIQQSFNIFHVFSFLLKVTCVKLTLYDTCQGGHYVTRYCPILVTLDPSFWPTIPVHKL
uniref:Uncharacterized protein n=1 Tax=Tetranychus urticae TaxID=32264 RepID=T1KPD2_TETUR